MEFHSEQEIDKWAEMLADVYGKTQNYNKDNFEIFSHLTEVVGAFGKYAFKKKDYQMAKRYLPKIFAWSTMLFYKVTGTKELGKVILAKFPTVCYYCNKPKCVCIPGTTKFVPNKDLLKQLYFSKARKSVKSLAQFQLMFEEIYEETWQIDDHNNTDDTRQSNFRFLFIRLIEELSEMAEAIRFQHINETNFENEFADFSAWLFAIISSMHHISGNSIERIDFEKLVWDSYPGYCHYCGLRRCACRPEPVRELLSKPSFSETSLQDSVTYSYNTKYLNETIKDMSEGDIPVKFPLSFICVDLKDLSLINSKYGMPVGDEVLLFIANTIRDKISQKHILFRYKEMGDEFLILCQDFSSQEAEGLISRIKKGIEGYKHRASLLDNANDIKFETFKIEIHTAVSTCYEKTEINKSYKETGNKISINKRSKNKNH